jgi:hypothetical protein
MSARHELRRVVRGDDGLPVAGAELRLYAPGTSTPVDAYASMEASSPAAQPLVSDANGLITTYLDPGYYKIVTTFGESTDTIEHYAAADPIPAGALVTAARNADGELIARAFADGRAIFEADPVTDAAAEFLPGGTFSASPTNPRHRWIKVGDTSGEGALTQNCTVALDRNAGWLPGDIVGVAKGDTSTKTVTVSGLDADGSGTVTLKRSRDFILLICQSTDAGGLKFERRLSRRRSPRARRAPASPRSSATRRKRRRRTSCSTHPTAGPGRTARAASSSSGPFGSTRRAPPSMSSSTRTASSPTWNGTSSSRTRPTR